MATRKRRAPGASPQVQQQPGYPQETGNMSTEQYLNNWDDASMAGDMGTGFDPSFYGELAGQLSSAAGLSGHNRIVSLDGDNSTMGADSGQLVRRNPNQQLAARGRTPWEFDNGEQGDWEQGHAEDEDDELEQKAIIARKDAQAKRKSIPPFVQKLSSFLDDNKNTTLIRWSDDGSSFIVLDEDEFARTLIPELFKHNNYASFVRQLNMYGFHKKVGLSDNSMKSSETKAKAPSEYYNKYFKRGRSELLWLIQKPKNSATGPKRKRDDDKQGDSDEDRKYGPDGGGGGYGEDLAVRGNQEMTMIPRTEYNSLRSEVRALQQQQKAISNVLTQIRRQNDQLYSQATAFQTLHDRHENSINAILTFLATFYNRTLESNNGANIADMFGAAAAQQQQQPHGNVIDIGDFPEKSFTKSPQMQRQGRRPLALLPAPAAKDGMGPTGRAATLSPSLQSPAVTPLSKPSNRQSVFRSPAMQTRNPPGSTGFGNQTANPGTPNVVPKVETPSTMQGLSPLPENDEVMSAIQNINANANQTTQAPQFDFPAALAQYQAQGGNVPLTPQQRNDVLSLIANNASAASPNSALAQNTNNALVNPQPPAMPDLSQFAESQAQLELLHKMSEDTNSRVHTLQERLQPLSPSGTIPGLTDNSYFGSSNLGEPGAYDLDLDSFVQGDDYFPQNASNSQANTGDVTLPDLNFEMPDANQEMNGGGFQGGNDQDLLGFDGLDDGGRIESVSSSATSPAVTVEDAEEDRPKQRSPKRRKK